MKTPLFSLLRCVTGLVSVLASSPAWADRTINYQSTLEAVNQQSNGAPIDDSFTFELGTFIGDFLPSPLNAAEWLSHWAPAPNSSNSPFSGAMVGYSTDPVPFGGPANAFQGFVTLSSNDTPFAPGKQGYFWGFNERESVPAAEWVLLSNANWEIPTVLPGEIELSDLNWLTSDLGTYSVMGQVNPGFDPEVPAGVQPPHITSSLVAIPEPQGLVLLALPAVWLLRRHRPDSIALS